MDPKKYFQVYEKVKKELLFLSQQKKKTIGVTSVLLLLPLFMLLRRSVCSSESADDEIVAGKSAEDLPFKIIVVANNSNWNQVNNSLP